MTMDLLSIDAIVAELRGQLSGAAVGKVHQPGPHEVVLRLWTGRENLRLLISADPHASRLHLLAANLPNPPAPPRFCQLLRSRLTRLLAFEPLAGDRCVRLLFAGEGAERWTLVAELLGPRSNLILLDADGLIVDALQRREESRREVAPGRRYLPPLNPPRFDLAAGLPDAVLPAAPFADWLLEHVTPMTPLVAADLAAAVAVGLTPRQALDHFRSRFVGREFEPLLVSWQQRLLLTPCLPDYLELEQVRRFDSFSQAAEAFYAGGTAAATFGGGRSELTRIVRRERDRLQKRLRHIGEEEEKARGGDRQRQTGELLLANLHRLRRGLDNVTLTDWYADPPVEVTIPLDPALSPQQNAEGHFRRHRKAKRALEHAARRRAETMDELEWLEGAALALEEAETPAEYEAIRQELVAVGLSRRRVEPGPGRRPAAPQPQLGSAVTPGGYRLYWGKNNRSNDHVSCRLAAADDLWFHAHALPGCHLVLKRERRLGEVPEADLLYAAAIAAAHSRGRDAGKVEVMVSEGRWVKKAPGAKPGLVRVERFRTVMVRPLQADDAGG